MKCSENAKIKKAWYKKWWVWAISIALFGAVFATAGNDKNNNNTASSTETTPIQQEQSQQTELPQQEQLNAAEQQETPLEPVAVVSAEDFYEEYSGNSLAADKKYKGKTVLITGHAGIINEDILGAAFLTIDADEFGISSIQCYFKNEDELLDIRKGDYVEVQGTVDGVVVTAPTLKNCTLK